MAAQCGSFNHCTFAQTPHGCEAECEPGFVWEDPTSGYSDNYDCVSADKQVNCEFNHYFEGGDPDGKFDRICGVQANPAFGDGCSDGSTYVIYCGYWDEQSIRICDCYKDDVLVLEPHINNVVCPRNYLEPFLDACGWDFIKDGHNPNGPKEAWGCY